MTNLQSFRINRNIYQKKMAELLNVSLSYYSKIEQGNKTPSYAIIKNFKRLYPDEFSEEIFFT